MNIIKSFVNIGVTKMESMGTMERRKGRLGERREGGGEGRREEEG